ncbi:MAG: polymer-forming cytoskeletal protein [Myxococcota bacterium]
MARQSQSTPADPATLIGPGIHVRGRVTGEEDLHIEGRLEGSIELTETVFVAPEGIVIATVQARDVVVSGVVVGNVTAEDSVTLNAGAKLVGDVTAPRVIVADGASFSGNVAMGGEPPPPRKRKNAARRAAPAKPAAKAVAKPAAKAAAKPAAKKAAKKAPAKKAPARVAAIPTPRAAKRDDDDTIVVKHAAVESASKKTSKKKTSKKAPPRARVPKPGKRRVGRR